MIMQDKNGVQLKDGDEVVWLPRAKLYPAEESLGRISNGGVTWLWIDEEVGPWKNDYYSSKTELYKRIEQDYQDVSW